MNRILFAAVALIAGCTPAQQGKIVAAANTPAGQLYCMVNTVTGPLVKAAIDAEALRAGLGPVAIIATGAAKQFVDDVCAAAGGVPVPPPANPDAAPKVAVVKPA